MSFFPESCMSFVDRAKHVLDTAAWSYSRHWKRDPGSWYALTPEAYKAILKQLKDTQEGYLDKLATIRELLPEAEEHVEKILEKEKEAEDKIANKSF